MFSLKCDTLNVPSNIECNCIAFKQLGINVVVGYLLLMNLGPMLLPSHCMCLCLFNCADLVLIHLYVFGKLSNKRSDQGHIITIVC